MVAGMQDEPHVPDIGDRLLRLREAAELLALSERQVWNLIAEGSVEVVRIGRSTRIRASGLRRLMDKGHPHTTGLSGSMRNAREEDEG